MNKEEILKKINSAEYDFLRTEPSLGKNIMLLTLGGSLAYGTNIATSEHTSDLDLRGVSANTIEEILSLNLNDKPFEDRNLDVVIHPFNKMCDLLCKCNPNTIEILGTKEEHLFHLSKEGKILRDNANLFLSQTAYHSFGGYATAQLRRLQNALARGEYPQGEKEEHILKTVQRKILSFEERYTPLTNDMLHLYLEKSNKAGYDKEIFMDINLTNYPLRDFGGIYSEIRQIVSEFDKLNHRNSKKDKVHLLKHAMHLLRLLKMGTEILEGKGINTYREHDKEFFLDVRMEKYTFDEIFEIADTFEKEFEYAKKNTVLPEKVDRKKVDDLKSEITLSLIKSSF